MSDIKETILRCTRCGTRSPESMFVCPCCGYDLGQYGVPDAQPEPKKTINSGKKPEKQGKNKPDSENRKFPAPLFIVLAVLVLALIMLAFFFMQRPDAAEHYYSDEVTETALSAETTEATLPQKETLPPETIPEIPKEPPELTQEAMDRMLAERFGKICGDYAEGRVKAGAQSSLAMDTTKTITFLDTIQGAPAYAWDVSYLQNGKVLAWLVNGVDLYVAAEGGVVAPENSRFLFGAPRLNVPFHDVTQINFNGNFDTTYVKSMEGMFACCAGLSQLDLQEFDTTFVTNMSEMFYSCESLTQLQLGNFRTYYVTDMSAMFSGCANLTQLDVSTFDTSAVTDMQFLFSGMEHLEQIDLKGFDTANVTAMTGMFQQCAALTELDLGSFDTGNVTDMSMLFQHCGALTKVNVSSFDTRNVTDMRYLFACCRNLEELDLNSFDASAADTYDMFYECPAGRQWQSRLG